MTLSCLLPRPPALVLVLVLVLVLDHVAIAAPPTSTSTSIKTSDPAHAAAPRYADALRAELEAMGREPSCELETRARFRCIFAAPSIAGAAMHAVYSDETDTVYVYVERYAMLPPDGPQTPALLRRMMELNWQLLVGKLEWSARSGEVRLSAVLNTDSNFDRRALRGLVLALDAVAGRYRAELGGGT